MMNRRPKPRQWGYELAGIGASAEVRFEIANLHNDIQTEPRKKYGLRETARRLLVEPASKRFRRSCPACSWSLRDENVDMHRVPRGAMVTAVAIAA